MIRLKNKEVDTIQVIIPAESPKKLIERNKLVSNVIIPIMLVLRLLF
ncbi:hypothetical protein [Tenacibaculum sp. Ill]